LAGFDGHIRGLEGVLCKGAGPVDEVADAVNVAPARNSYWLGRNGLEVDVGGLFGSAVDGWRRSIGRACKVI